MDTKAYFKVHKLNETGLNRARELAEKFDALAQFIDGIGQDGREKSLAMTKLEEASFFSKKSLAIKPENQE